VCGIAKDLKRSTGEGAPVIHSGGDAFVGLCGVFVVFSVAYRRQEACGRIRKWSVAYLGTDPAGIQASSWTTHAKVGSRIWRPSKLTYVFLIRMADCLVLRP
jgi:hypothetical protein